MRKGYFVNKAFDMAITKYIDSVNNKDSIEYNSFLVVTIRILILIYGKLDILNPYYLGNGVALMNNLAKFGVPKSDIALFKDDFLNFFEFAINSENQIYKKPNPYFKRVQKYLIDMFIAKKNNGDVSMEEEEKFLDLIYSTHTTNPYRISYAYLMQADLIETEKYYYTKLNELDMTKELSKTINENLNLEALNILGINLSNLKDMSNTAILKAQNAAYEYFEVDATDLKREDKLNDALNYYKKYGKKVTTGNGYVDILLLMSVIVTSFSIIAIIIFSFM